MKTLPLSSIPTTAPSRHADASELTQILAGHDVSLESATVNVTVLEHVVACRQHVDAGGDSLSACAAFRPPATFRR
jgi:hypothetical protein